VLIAQGKSFCEKLGIFLSEVSRDFCMNEADGIRSNFL